MRCFLGRRRFRFGKRRCGAVFWGWSRKAPGTRRCIETGLPHLFLPPGPFRRKAPSTRRCIETRQRGQRGHGQIDVGKHQAPEGALRPAPGGRKPHGWHRRKAPSTRRCIETSRRVGRGCSRKLSRKAPSTRRCIKTWFRSAPEAVQFPQSESTKHQKVH